MSVGVVGKDPRNRLTQANVLPRSIVVPRVLLQHLLRNPPPFALANRLAFGGRDNWGGCSGRKERQRACSACRKKWKVGLGEGEEAEELVGLGKGVKGLVERSGEESNLVSAELMVAKREDQ